MDLLHSYLEIVLRPEVEDAKEKMKVGKYKTTEINSQNLSPQYFFGNSFQFRMN